VLISRRTARSSRKDETVANRVGSNLPWGQTSLYFFSPVCDQMDSFHSC
jgi:hypothetical protein